jgi:2-(3-amino-3-carboxypropyl)histidine synthase
MQPVSISDIEKKYDLELEKVVREIKKNKAKTVLLQFPDGMKPYSTVIAAEIEKRTKVECMVWFGSCFGGCDIPHVNNVDLVVQFGHQIQIL